MRREWRKDPKNAGLAREWNRKWRKDTKNVEKERERSREWRKDTKNADRARERLRQWLKDPRNLDRMRDKQTLYRRREKLSQNTLAIASELQQLKKHLTENQNEHANTDQTNNAS